VIVMRSNSHNHRRRSTTPLNGYENAVSAATGTLPPRAAGRARILRISAYPFSPGIQISAISTSGISYGEDRLTKGDAPGLAHARMTDFQRGASICRVSSSSSTTTTRSPASDGGASMVVL
jgi:hypothetical protein